MGNLNTEVGNLNLSKGQRVYVWLEQYIGGGGSNVKNGKSDGTRWLKTLLEGQGLGTLSEDRADATLKMHLERLL